MNKVTTILLFFIPLLIEAQTAKTAVLNLQEVIEKSVTQSWSVKNAQEKQIASKAKQEQAVNAFLPQIGATVAYTRLSTNIDPFKIAIPGFGEKVLNPVIPNQFTNRASIQQPIFNGLRNINMLNATKNLSEAAKLDIEKESIDVKVQAIQNYFNYWKATGIVAVLTKNKELAEKRLQDIKNFSNAGIALKNDVMKAELNKSTLELNLAEMENTATILNYNLLVQMGISEDVLIMPAVDDLIVKSIESDKENTNENIVSARNEWRSMTLRKIASLKMLNASKSLYMPVISAGFNFYYNNPNQRVFPQENKFKDTWDAGISLTWNLTQLYTAGAMIKEAKSNLKQSENMQEQVKDGIKLELFSAKKGYEFSLKKIEIAQRAVEQATENQKITKNRTDASIALFSDLLEADNQLLQADLNLTSAKCEAQIAYYKYLKATGKLN